MPPKRTAFTVIEKQSLRSYHAQHPHLNQQELRAWFESQFGKPITQGSVSQFLGSSYSHLDSAEAAPIRQPDRKRNGIRPIRTSKRRYTASSFTNRKTLSSPARW
ncbi:hypothetical protein WHR41_09128 [Cladosporium halotolerans]|uniref:ARS-binding protein 1 N-terminal domain-containing protein n=1 Tax=Cladosporium halotolerans TaxID=1052096 RepID=A0AB34KEC8_9PEZI